MPMADLAGGMTFIAAVRHGQMDFLRGQVSVDQLTLAQRPVRNLKANIDKPSGASVATD